jgi:anti-sigma28 factor (negative regulator of flagellin synthesis)
MRLQLDTYLPGLNGSEGAAAAGSAVRSAGAGRTQASGSVDTASISTTSSLLSQLSTERAARIQQLTAAVRNGSYDVPSSTISHAIVQEAFS